jgi:HSP20 family protein
MANITRWEPFREMESLRDAMERLFEERSLRPSVPFWGPESLAIDMWETDENVVIKTSIPGLKPEEIDISVTGDSLSIRAETKEEEEIRRENYLRRERRFGSLCRTVTLPGGLKTDEAEADYSDGVLTLTFPKMEEVKPKSIKVTGKGQ